MPSQPIKIELRTISAASTGDLTVIESSRDLPFSIKRIYYIYGMDRGSRRGFHAHRQLYQLLAAIHGSFELRLEGPSGSFVFKLSRPNEGVLIPPGYWREMHDLGPDTVVMVMASEDYDEEDYIRDYDDFKRWQAESSEPGPVPYLDLSRPDLPPKEMEQALGAVVKGGRFVNGPRLKEFEEKLAEMAGVEHAVGVGNGLDALTLTLDALDIGTGDEVIVCAAGFVATALAVSRLGARPVFIDCRPNANLDPDQLVGALSARTRAVIPTHLYGYPADMEAIGPWADRHDLAVVEDACQAHGSSLRGRPCGSWGRAAAFSFYPTKNLGALGDGGCVVTNEAALAEKIRRLANYGSSRRYHHEFLGYNSRLDELQAAVLLLKVGHLPSWNERRRHLAATYEQALKNIDGLEVPEVGKGVVTNWHVFAVRVKGGRRDRLAEFLAGRDIGTNIHYPQPLHRQECYRDEYGTLSFPEAESWAAETLSLPLSPTHTQSEIDRVCDAVREYFSTI